MLKSIRAISILCCRCRVCHLVGMEVAHTATRQGRHRNEEQERMVRARPRPASGARRSSIAWVGRIEDFFPIGGAVSFTGKQHHRWRACPVAFEIHPAPAPDIDEAGEISFFDSRAQRFQRHDERNKMRASRNMVLRKVCRAQPMSCANYCPLKRLYRRLNK